MTRFDARDAAAVMLAWADGKEVECKFRVGGTWNTLIKDRESGFNWIDFTYRVKSTAKPNLRPWTADEVPLGAWIRSKGTTYRSMITSTGFELDRKHWSIGFEHSTDCGKTWLPCGTMI